MTKVRAARREALSEGDKKPSAGAFPLTFDVYDRDTVPHTSDVEGKGKGREFA
jgi:hypothetical protein